MAFGLNRAEVIGPFARPSRISRSASSATARLIPTVSTSSPSGIRYVPEFSFQGAAAQRGTGPATECPVARENAMDVAASGEDSVGPAAGWNSRGDAALSERVY